MKAQRKYRWCGWLKYTRKEETKDEGAKKVQMVRMAEIHKKRGNKG